MKAVAMVTAAVLVVMGIGVGVLAATGNGLTVPGPINAAVVRFLRDQQNIRLRAAPRDVVPRDSGNAAMSGNVLSSTDVVAEQLCELTGVMTHGSPVLVWAIQEALTGSQGEVTSAVQRLGGGPPMIARGHFNFRLDLVNATTGMLLFAVEGRVPTI